MREEEALEVLRAHGVLELAYSVGIDKDEAYCLVPDQFPRFHVYYSERGHRRDEKVFDSQECAFDDLVTRLVEDPTTRAEYPYREPF